MFSLALLASLAASQSGPITKDFGVLRADVLISQVGQQTGQAMKADVDFQRDFVYANVKEMPVEDMKASLAQLLQGRWREEGDVLVLRPLERVANIPEYMARLQARNWAASLAPEAPPLTQAEAAKLRQQAPGKAGDGDGDFFMGLDRRDPLKKLGRIFAKEFIKNEMATFASWERRVYSSRPMGGERALPSGVASQLMGLRREAGLFSTIVEASMRGEEGTEVVAQPYQEFAAGQRTVQVSVSMFVGTLFLQVSLINPDNPYGEVLDSLALAPEYSQAEAPAAEKAATDEPVSSDPSMDWVREGYWGKLGLGQTPFKVPASWPVDPKPLPEGGVRLSPRGEQWLANMEREELLQLVADGPLDDVVQKRGKGLITLVSDGTLGFLLSRPRMLAEFASSLYSSEVISKVRLVEQGANTLLFAENPWLDRLERVDRAAVARVIRSVRSGGKLVDALGSWASQSPFPGQHWRFWTTLGFGVEVPVYGPREWAILGFYGGLGPAGARQARTPEGASVSATSLIPLQTQRLIDLAWGQNSLLWQPAEAPASGGGAAPEAQTEDPLGGLDWRSVVDGMAAERDGASTQGWEPKGDPIRMAPFPLSPGSAVIFRVKEAPSLLYLPPMMGSLMVAEPYSAASVSPEALPKEASPEMASDLSKSFMRGLSTFLELDVRLGSKGRLMANMVFDEPVWPIRRIGLKDAPSAFQEAVARALKSIKDSEVEPYSPSGPGGGTPPSRR